MARAILSILGMYNYDHNLFNHLFLPDDMDRDLCVNAILRKCAELPLMWPDLPLMQSLMGYWSRQKKPTWERMWEVAHQEYNPLENYDRMEEWDDRTTDTKSGTGTGTRSASSTRTGKVAGYNSESLVNKDSDVTSGSGQNSATTSESGSGTAHREGRAHGNIGVTTSQQMLESELNIAPRLDIYDWIAEEFKHEFCLMLY